MAIQGNLQDVNFASLIQMLCMDQRSVTLNLKHPRAEEGVIYFEQGEIVHALTDSLVGEEAVYHLLSWTEGTFKVSDQATVSTRTIIAPWNSLLMEGMRLLDEKKISGSVQIQPEAVLSSVEMEQDSALENELILLLSQLEQIQTRLTQNDNGKQPTTALQIIAETINEVVTLTENLPDTAKNVDAPSEMLTQAAKTYSTLRLLNIKNNRLSTKIVSKLYTNWTGNIAERRQTFVEISQGMLIIVEKYFACIVAQFRSNVIANQWQETCQIFLTELKQAVEEIQF